MDPVLPHWRPLRHGLDDHVWIVDTGLYVWILCFHIRGLGVMAWMLVLTTHGSKTQAYTCGSCASALEATASWLGCWC